MPILSFGTFSVNMLGHDPALVLADHFGFTYYPFWLIGVVVWGACLVSFLLSTGFLEFAGSWRERFPPTAHAVLVPGLIGIGCAFTGNPEWMVLCIPLQVVTLVFLAWGGIRRGDLVPVMASALIVSIAVSILVLLLLGEESRNALQNGSFYGLLAVFPLITIRFAVRNGVTWSRLLVGFVLGFLLPPVVIALFMLSVPHGDYYFSGRQLLSSARLDQMLASLFGVQHVRVTWVVCFSFLIFLAFSAIPSFVLVRWNSWGRSVAGGFGVKENESSKQTSFHSNA